MLERFTRPARQAVETATACARQATASEVRPDHLFEAVLHDEDCLAVRVLDDAGAPAADLLVELSRRRSAYVDGLDADDAEALAAIGIDLDEVVRRIDANLGGIDPAPSRGRPPFSRETKKALELALREAVALRHGYIGTEHLLLGLVRQGDRVVTETVTALGLEPAALRACVAEAVREAG